jgi:hypothetical protein
MIESNVSPVAVLIDKKPVVVAAGVCGEVLQDKLERVVCINRYHSKIRLLRMIIGVWVADGPNTGGVTADDDGDVAVITASVLVTEELDVDVVAAVVVDGDGDDDATTTVDVPDAAVVDDGGDGRFSSIRFSSIIVVAEDAMDERSMKAASNHEVQPR